MHSVNIYCSVIYISSPPCITIIIPVLLPCPVKLIRNILASVLCRIFYIIKNFGASASWNLCLALQHFNLLIFFFCFLILSYAFFYIKKLNICSVSVCMCMLHYTWRTEDTLQETVVFFHLVCSGAEVMSLMFRLHWNILQTLFCLLMHTSCIFLH